MTHSPKEGFPGKFYLSDVYLFIVSYKESLDSILTNACIVLCQNWANIFHLTHKIDFYLLIVPRS